MRRLVGGGGPETPDESPDEIPELLGWLAIDRALENRYGDIEPRHWGTVVSWRLGGPDPLDGVSAMTATARRRTGIT